MNTDGLAKACQDVLARAWYLTRNVDSDLNLRLARALSANAQREFAETVTAALARTENAHCAVAATAILAFAAVAKAGFASLIKANVALAEMGCEIAMPRKVNPAYPRARTLGLAWPRKRSDELAEHLKTGLYALALNEKLTLASRYSSATGEPAKSVCPNRLPLNMNPSGVCFAQTGAGLFA